MDIQVFAELRSQEPMDPREVEEVVKDYAQSRTARCTHANADSAITRNGLGMVTSAPIVEYVYSLTLDY